jgi:exoribonuclease R
VPWDWRVPLIRIQTRQFGQLSNQRIVVNIDSWDVNSMHPTGHYVRSLGEIGLAETDVQSLLVENQISYSEFGPNMMSSLP